MQCLTNKGGGKYELTNPQPDSYTTCISVLASPSDLGINSWALTPAQGLQIATAIGILWTTAYTFRVIGQFLSNRSSNSNEGD